MDSGHELEERMLKEASRLRKEAQQLREERLKARDEAASGLEKLRKASEAERQRKKRRDEEIRAFLLPLAESFKRTGWRVKGFAGSPVLTLTRSNQYPPEEVVIYWKESGLSGTLGFYWE